MKPTEFNINNYTVIYIPNNTDVTMVQSFIIGGNFAEKEKESGISHLLEHVIIDGWKKCKGKCIDYWSDKGISFNAYTDNTLVSYFITGIQLYNEDMIKFISDITTNPYFNNNLISKCKDAVKEELLIYQNNPEWILDNLYNKTIYNETGLNHNQDISLKLNVLDSLTKDNLINFFNKWYNPSNIVFTVTTKLPIDDVKQIMKKSLKKNSYKQIKYQLVSFPKPSLQFVKYNEAKKVIFRIGFVSDIKPMDDDSIYIGLISDMLCGDLTSFLHKILRDKLNLIYGIKLTFDNNYCNIVSTFSVSCIEKNAKKLIENFINLMNIFIVGKYNDDLIKRTKYRLKMVKSETCENTNFLSNFYGNQYIMKKLVPDKKIYSFEETNNNIQNISKKDIVRISNRLFNFDTITIAYMYKNEIDLL